MSENLNDSRTETDAAPVSDVPADHAAVDVTEQGETDTLLDQVEAQATLDTIDEGVSRRTRRRAGQHMW
ncbi:MAG: hypothetical protein HC834_07955 [Rhodospirillales bacterium]|nr:hypothetical protein [Rhodospirillales bacterium]